MDTDGHVSSRKREGDKVIEHLIRLGSGLESMLIGEPQIPIQLKEALDYARAQSLPSAFLEELFEKTIAAGVKIWQRTGIERGTLSLGSAALKLAEEDLGRLDDQGIFAGWNRPRCDACHVLLVHILMHCVPDLFIDPCVQMCVR